MTGVAVRMPTVYRVVAEKTPDECSRFVLAGQAITVDTTADMGTLPGPADLLTAAFAACVLKNVDRFSRLLPFRYERAEIEVTTERQERPPRMKRVSYVLRVTTDEPAGRVDLLHRNIVRYGTVFNTLAAACPVEGRIETLPADQDSRPLA